MATDTVDKLFVGTTQLAAGIYGAGNIVIPQITGTGKAPPVPDGRRHARGRPPASHHRAIKTLKDF